MIKKRLNHPLVSVITYVLLVFFVIFGTKAYLGYLTIQQTIKSNQAHLISLQTKAIYFSAYRLGYLESEYAPYFVAHENGVAHPGERKIVIHKTTENPLVEQTIVSPSGQRKTLIKPKSTGRRGYFEYKLQQVGK
ncbi:MAG TPA: hypothetical protein PLW93_03705 [Candidatus Absconditabacterales bacterium]|nr:hypothetical protein [Candidatus Absconditabacterales bacterium]HNG97351.1 hypothetical protein [Candidatus Absconditabacterales bacterium]